MGSAWGLFGNWIKWFLLSVITLGFYLFWVGPRIARWKWENTDLDPTWRSSLPTAVPSAALSGYAPLHSLGAHAARPNGIPQER